MRSTTHVNTNTSSLAAGRARMPAVSDRPRHGRSGAGEPMALETMRAAVIAIRAGVFDRPPAPPPGPVLTVDRDLGVSFDVASPVVVVLAGHPGAGASTVALAIADALAAQRRVDLVEYADPHRSGLGVAGDRELGVDEDGWRRGLRGSVHLARMDHPCPPVGQWPAPPAGRAEDGGRARLRVLDAGMLPADAVTGGGWLPAELRAAALVVVTRITVAGVRQTEHLLDALGAPAVLAAVGDGRWPGVVAASCGPHLRADRSSGRAVMVPIVRRLEVDGLTPAPLPKPVAAAAGKALAALLSPDQQPLTGLALTAPRERS